MLAALIVDMQEYFIRGESYRDSLITNQLAVLDWCGTNDVPVVLVEYKNHGPTTDKILNSWEKLRLKDRVEKSGDDGFYGTDLDDILKRFSSKQQIVMGVNGCACVYQTGFSAKVKGYELYVSRNTVNDLGGEEYWYKSNTHLFDDYEDMLSELIPKKHIEIDNYVSILQGALIF